MLEIAEFLNKVTRKEDNPERQPLSNYIPKHLLQDLQESLSKALEIPLLFTSWDGMPITRSEELHTFCHRFTHLSKIERPCQKCMRFTDIDVIGSEAGMARIPQPDDCPCGLSDIVVPIALGSRISAFMLTSQTMAKRGARDQAMKTMLDMGIEKSDASRFISDIKTIDFSQVEKIEEALTSIAEVISSTAMNYAKSYRLAIRDPLTGLMNRAYMWEYLNAKINNQECNDEPFSIMVLDVSNLREINDSMGQEAGDEALKTVAQVFENLSRPYDLAVRYSGNRFVLMLEKIDGKMAQRVADRIAYHIEKSEIKYDNQSSRIKADLNILDYPKCHGMLANEIFKSVDNSFLSKPPK